VKPQAWGLALGLIFLPLLADARIGGGHSYSGGGSRGGGGWSGGGSHYSGGGSRGGDIGAVVEIVFHMFRGLVWLTFHHPWIGVPLDLVIFFAVRHFFIHGGEYTIRAQAYGPDASARRRRVTAAENLRGIHKYDPDFSRALFMDFAYALFAEVHESRASRKLSDLALYLRTEVINGLALLSPQATDVKGVVIGGASIVSVSSLDQPEIRITVEFMANYTETVKGADQSWYATETWTFVRSRTARSRPPEKIRLIACPSCGAAPKNDGSNACASCGASNLGGRLDWFVESRSGRREERPPLLTSTVDEVGTNLPTLYDPSAKTSGLDAQAFVARARVAFLELQAAWTERRWDRARPFETDAMFQTHSYWMAEYRKQGLVNALKNVQIHGIIPVKVEQDRHYDSVTARIYARMEDYTVEERNQKVLSGRPGKLREFSEYWTFIRGRGSRGPKRGTDPLGCPSCGAPLKINMAGHCEYCQAKVTSGEFDWVLSMIEQDEEYHG
jgi:predicted lipid-binding transport protein (Tim44 family)